MNWHKSVSEGATVFGIADRLSIRSNLLTDSGGFQMVSLLELAEITEVRNEFTVTLAESTASSLTGRRQFPVSRRWQQPVANARAQHPVPEPNWRRYHDGTR